VVGGGIGGMEAARLCAMRGHEVTLYEKSGELGGVFVAAAAPDFKEADKKLVQWYRRQIRDNKIDIRMNTEVTPEVLKKTAPQVVIVATGSKPKRLPVPGIDGDNVIESVDFLLGKKQVGAKVVVVGGGLTGCEIAYDLAKKGKAVTLVEMLDDILKIPGLSAANSNMLRELLTYYKVEVLKSTRLREITATDVKVVSNGVDRTLATDTVVIAAGYDPCLEVAERLKDCGEVHVIGDARHVGNLMTVVWDAYDLALKV
jgi:2-enoate reductase